VEQAAARPSAEPAEQDVPEAEARQPVLAGTVLPRAAEHEVSVLPRAVEHAASAPQAAEHAGRQGEVAAAAPVAVGAAAEQRVSAERAEAEEVVARREAPGAPGALPSGPPWAVAWAFRRDRLPLWPAPRPTARSARAMEQRPIAWP